MPYLTSVTDYLSWTVPRKYEVEFNAMDFHYDDPRTATELLTAAVGGPFMTPNEARKIRRFEPLDGGDQLLENIGDISVGKGESTSKRNDRAERDSNRDKSGKTDK